MELEARKIFEDDRPLDHRLMMECINELSQKYGFLGVTSLGESILGRSIPILTLGEGKKSILYVGGQRGNDGLTSELLLRYVTEFCQLYEGRSSIYNYSSELLFKLATVYVVPMLNPDGIDYRIRGVSAENPLRERLIRMNGGSDDFSAWQSNARGVDLCRNFNFGFAAYKRAEAENDIREGREGYSGNMPESEPETACLCNFLRFNEEIGTVIVLDTGAGEIYSSGDSRREKNVESAFSKITGYRVLSPEGDDTRGGLADWSVSELSRRGFTVKCGKRREGFPSEDNFKIYLDVRELLLTAPVF